MKPTHNDGYNLQYVISMEKTGMKKETKPVSERL